MAVVGGLLLLFISFSIAYSIFTRKLNLPTPIWVVQFNEYALLWITFLATAWILARDKHVSVQFLVQYMGPKTRKTMGFVHSIVGMGLCGVMCWYGFYTTWDHYIREVIDVGSVDVPKAYVLAIIPLGFFLLTLQFLHRVLTGWSEEPADAGGGHETAKGAGKGGGR